jgi:hypothetical protein
MSNKIVYRMVDQYFTDEENAKIYEFSKAGRKEDAMAYMYAIGRRWDQASANFADEPENVIMRDFVEYNPAIHKNLPLYRLVTEKQKDGSFATSNTLVEDKTLIDNAPNVPFYYLVRQSDIDAQKE